MATVSRPSPNGQPAVRPSRTRREPTGIARLELLINENHYKVRPTSAGSIAEVRSFRLRKADGTIHIVSETLEGCTCTCLDYIKVRSLKGQHCKHPGLTHHNSESGLYEKFRVPSKPRLLPYSLATFR